MQATFGSSDSEDNDFNAADEPVPADDNDSDDSSNDASSNPSSDSSDSDGDGEGDTSMEEFEIESSDDEAAADGEEGQEDEEAMDEDEQEDEEDDEDLRTAIANSLADVAVSVPQPPKRRRVIDPSPNSPDEPCSSRSTSNSNFNSVSPLEDGSSLADEQSGSSCSICFEDYEMTGEHRIVSLKCGHLYGKHCIEQWINGTGIRNCPECKKPAKKLDIRPIFGRAFYNADTLILQQRVDILQKEKSDLAKQLKCAEENTAALQVRVEELEKQQLEKK